MNLNHKLEIISSFYSYGKESLKKKQLSYVQKKVVNQLSLQNVKKIFFEIPMENLSGQFTTDYSCFLRKSNYLMTSLRTI